MLLLKKGVSKELFNVQYLIQKTQNNPEFMSQTGKVPTIFIELCDKKGSGFILDNTEGTKFEQELDCPSVQFVPNTSYRYVDRLISEQPKGGTKTERILEQIRYITNNPEISVILQDKSGWKSNSKTDKIKIFQGNASIAREGSHVGLFDFLTQSVEFNGSNPDKLAHARPIYNIIDLLKVQEEQNEEEIAINEARSFVYNLQEKKNNVWVYQTERIDALCELFSVYAASSASKITLLANYASTHPDNFLKKIKIFEAETAVLVAHALQLHVIGIDGQIVSYVGKNKIIKNLSGENTTQANKIEELSTYLRTKDGYEAAQELKAEVKTVTEANAEKK